MNTRVSILFFGVLAATIVLPCLATAEVVFDRTPASTGATEIMLWATGADYGLIDVKTGEPAAAPSLHDVATSNGGKLRWEVERDWVDDLGYHHVYYRQHFRPHPSTTTVPQAFIRSGVPISGGVLTFHFDSEGRLYAVHGAMFEDVESTQALQVDSREAAQARAWWALEHVAGHGMPDLDTLRADLKEYLKKRSKLRVTSKGTGHDFEFVWEVLTQTEGGEALSAAIHGNTFELLRVWDPNPKARCEPDCIASGSVPCEDEDVAIGLPENTSLPNRSIRATPGWFFAGATHEAHQQLKRRYDGEFLSPDIQVFMGFGNNVCDPDDPAAACQDQDHPPLKKLNPNPLLGRGYYQLVEVESNMDGPIYREHTDNNGLEIPGNIAGDALLKTSQTMDVFKDYLGWRGFNNSADSINSIARIVVDTYDGCRDNARFQDAPWDKAPLNSVAVCEKALRDFSQASSLDVIAHEWGHGVAFSVGREVTSDLERQLHEGFADVIGYGVERLAEGEGPENGSTFERADWVFGEDSSGSHTPFRSTVVNDGPCADTAAVPGSEYCTGPYSFHADDQGCTWNSGEENYFGQFLGHRLAVAYKLAAAGGQNPACEDVPSLLGCGHEIANVGDRDAFRILFRVLTVHATEITSWDSLPDLAKWSALELFSQFHCDAAYTHQIAMDDAFRAIGYLGSGQFFCRCDYPCDPDQGG